MSSAPGSQASNGNTRDTSNGPEPPKKKRRTRVSRACDECRVRKIRCDGGQPCESCEAFDRECHYRTNRVQKPGGPQYIRSLEERISRARSYIDELHAKMPASAQKDLESIFESPGEFRSASHGSENAADDGSKSPGLEDMMDHQGLLSSTDRKKATFYGAASGFAFLRQTQHLYDIDRVDDDEHDLPQSTQRAITQLFDSPLPDKQALDIDVPVSHLLPSRKSTSDMLHVVFQQVHPLLQFLHEPTFQEKTDRIFDIEPMDFEDSDHDFLPLLYSVLALGILFSQDKHQKYGCGRAVTEAMRHFIAARQMVDVTNIRDIVSLQVLVCFILFLMSTARLTASHTYVGLALTSAIRLGLHSQGRVNDSFRPEEQGERRRVFESIIKMDIYASSVLGLPPLTNISRLEPTLLRDVELDLKQGRRVQAAGPADRSRIIASAKSVEVLLIIGKVVNTLYPDKDGFSGKGDTGGSGSRTFFVRNSDIADLEMAFKKWREQIPELLDTGEKDVALESISYELEMLHNFGHIVLYRPFLHYLARVRIDKPSDQRQLRCALACVSIARRTIVRSAEVIEQGFLAPASWHSIYTIFLSVVAMTVFVAAQGDSSESDKFHQAAEAGVRTLAACECQDTGAKRCLDVLSVLVKRLSHVLHLDVDAIRQQTPSLCQDKHPTGPKRALRQDASNGADETEKPLTNSPNLDWAVSDFSGSSTDFGMDFAQDLAQQSEQDPQHNQSHPHISQRYQPEQHFQQQQGPVNSIDAIDQFSASGYPYVTNVQMPSLDTPSFFQGRGDFHAAPPQSDVLEIPYTQGFAWPISSAPNEHFDLDGDSHGEHFDLYAGHQPLSSEDIAAYMRINPHDNPFM